MKKILYSIILPTFLPLFMFSQVQMTITFPDVVLSNNIEVHETNEWQFSIVKMHLSEKNSVFNITFIDPDNAFLLYQITPWIKEGEVNKCTVVTEDEKHRFYLYFTNNDFVPKNISLVLKAHMGDEIEIFGKAVNKISLQKPMIHQEEIIMFINPDGYTAHTYVNSKDDATFSRNPRSYKTENTFIKKREFYYTYPDAILDSTYFYTDLLYPAENPYVSFLVFGDILASLTIDDDGIFTYTNGSIENSTEGVTSNLTGYDELRLSWIIPENLEILSYRSNKSGEWKKFERGITFTSGKGVNDVVWEIKYRARDNKVDDDTEYDEYKEVINLPGNKVKISIWDNEEVDGDIISIEVNGEWIIKNLEVKQCKTTFFIDLPHQVNYLMLKAENVGGKSPNTSAFMFECQNFTQTVILNCDTDIMQKVVITTPE